MAAGKTTLGVALAEACGRRFVDLDKEIEARAGRSISSIFASEAGEGGFRELEATVLRDVARNGDDIIVACGGGTPCYGDNIDFMLGAGLVVCLEASPDTTVRRLLEAPEGKRPLVDSYRHDTNALRAHIAGMLQTRRPFYSRAHACFNADRLENAAEIAETTALFTSLFMK